MTIYDRIRQLRISQGLSQVDLAKRMGYKDGSMITKIESGSVDISQKKIVAFAEALSTTPAYLMGWTDTPEKYIADSLTPDESVIINSYRSLSAEGKNYIHQQLVAARLMFGEKSQGVDYSRLG